MFSSFLSPWQQQPEHAGSWCGYLIGPDEGLHGQMILHQLLHVGLSSHQRGELRSSRQSQRRLVGGARRSTGVGVPEEHVPGLAGREEARRKRRRGETGERVRLENHSFWPRSDWFQETSVRRWTQRGPGPTCFCPPQTFICLTPEPVGGHQAKTSRSTTCFHGDTSRV